MENKREINLNVKEIEILLLSLLAFQVNLKQNCYHVETFDENIEKSEEIFKKLKYILTDLSEFGNKTDTKKEKMWDMKKRLKMLELEKEIKLILEFKE